MQYNLFEYVNKCGIYMDKQLVISNELVKATFSTKGAELISLEPWCGIQDFVDSDYDFVNKKGIIKLGGKEELTKTHKFIF